MDLSKASWSVFSALLVVLSLCEASGDIIGWDPNFTFDQCALLHKSPQTFTLEYSVVDPTKDPFVIIRMTAKTTGWIAVGISRDGSMDSNKDGSDMIIGWVSSDSAGCENGCVFDYFSTNMERPILDTKLGGKNDVTLLDASEVDGITSITFSRPLRTEDDFDLSFNFRKFESSFILYAMGERDPPPPKVDTVVGELFGKHFVKGARTYKDLMNSKCSGSVRHQTHPSFSNADKSFEMTWEISKKFPSEPSIEIQLKAKTLGWVGIGLTPPDDMLMPKSDMIVGWVKKGQAVVHDMHANGYNIPLLDQLNGGQSNIYDVSGSEENGYTILKFSRKLDTHDSKMDMMIGSGECGLLWAIGDTDGDFAGNRVKFAKHISRGMALIDFTEGYSHDSHHSYGHSGVVLTIHAFFMFVSWGVVAPFGIYVARYMNPHGVFGNKSSEVTQLWYEYHKYIQILAFALSTIGLIIVIKYTNDSGEEHFHHTHGVIGAIVFALASSQILLGYLANHMWDSNRTSPPLFPDKIHWWLGRSLLCLAVLTIGMGLELYTSSSIFKSLCVLYFVGVAFIFQLREYSLRRAQPYERLSTDQTANPNENDFTSKLLNKPHRTLAFVLAVFLVFGAVYNFQMQLSTSHSEEPDRNKDSQTRPDLSKSDRVRSHKNITKLCKTDDCVEFAIRFDKFRIPAQESVQYCHYFKVPAEYEYHITEFRVIRDNIEILHHAVLYRSNMKRNDDYFYCREMPKGATIVTAIGKSVGDVSDPPFTTPPDVGFRMGKGTDTLYLLLQIHYVNPERAEHHTDSSGFHLMGTRKLRTHDAGMGFVGLRNADISLPPQQKLTVVAGYCPMAKVDLVGGTINVFYYGMHMHQHGTIMRTEVYRDNSFYGTMGDTDKYDYVHQPSWSGHIVLQASDRILTVCGYDTSKEMHIITGGGDMGQEMCQTFFGYYPKLPGSTPLTCGGRLYSKYQPPKPLPHPIDGDQVRLT